MGLLDEIKRRAESGLKGAVEGAKRELARDATNAVTQPIKDAERSARGAVREGATGVQDKIRGKPAKPEGGASAPATTASSPTAGTTANAPASSASSPTADPVKSVKEGAGAVVDGVTGGAQKVWNFLKENHEKHKDDPPKTNPFDNTGASLASPSQLMASNMLDITDPDDPDAAPVAAPSVKPKLNGPSGMA